MAASAITASAAMFPGALLTTRQVPNFDGAAGRTIAVRLADCEGLRNEASILVNRMYAWRGYGDAHELIGTEHRVTFTASTDDEMIGTLTLTKDSSSGLSTDQCFEDELNELRKIPGTTLCELTKFAVDPKTKSPPVLAALFHVIFIFGIQKFGCTDVVIEVHPRHVRYYEAMLGFERVGNAKIDDSVEWWPSDTPVQLMRLNLAEMRRKIDLRVNGGRMNGRSLYPHFFSSEEEKGIAARVALLSGREDVRPRRARSEGAYWQLAA